MKSHSHLFLMVLIIYFSPHALAEQPVPFIRDGAVGLKMKGLTLPIDLFNKSLKSGLSTSFLVQAVFVDTHGANLQKSWLIKFRYDLWDEHFIIDQQEKESVIAKSEKDLFDKLSNLTLYPIIAKNEWQMKGVTQARVRFWLNPIEKEKIKEIRKWISKNAVASAGEGKSGIPGGAPGPMPATSGHGIRFPGLFDRLLDKQSTPSATWTTTLESKPFQLKDLANEK